MSTVSVVMAVHNGLPYLKEAVESVLGQTWRDFEFIVVDDASTDGSLELLESYEDARIRLMRNGQQAGLAASLNKGMDAAQGEFIARMDADDISLPGRLAQQVAFMRAQPEVAICGAWAQTIGGGRAQVWRYPSEDADIKAELLFASVLVHSSVMMRRSALDAHTLRYDEGLAQAQDYDLWVRAAEVLRLANLPKVLLRYRLHADQVGEQAGSGQQAVADEVRDKQLAHLGVEAIATDRNWHHRIARWDFGDTLEDLAQVERWLQTLLEANQQSQRYARASLERVIEARWWAACRAHVRHGLGTQGTTLNLPLC